MHNSIKTKLNIIFLVFMVIFMLISTLISLFVSRTLIINNVKSTNEQNLSVNVDYLNDLLNNSKDKLKLFVDDYYLSLKDIQSNQVTLIDNASNVYSTLRTFLYLNKEFSEIFIFSDELIIGTSKNNNSVVFRDPTDQPLESSKSFFLEQLNKYWQYNQQEISEKNLITLQTIENINFVAVLNLQEFSGKTDPGFGILNQQEKKVFGKNTKNPFIFEMSDMNAMQRGTYHTTVSGDFIQSAVQGQDGYFYVLMNDMGSINEKLMHIVWEIGFIGLGLFILFSIISIFWSGRILKPVYDFISHLKRIKGFEDRSLIKSYLSSYEGHSSVYKKIFRYYFIVLIPIFTMILISYFYFQSVVEENIRDNHMNILQRTTASVDNQINSLNTYIKYLGLDPEFQKIMVNKNQASDQVNLDFSDILVRKGVIDKNFRYVSIYDAENNLIYSDTNRRIVQEEKVKVDSLNSVDQVLLSLYVDERNQPVIRMKSGIKYLSPDEDKSNMFIYLGYIELGVDNLFMYNQFMNKAPYNAIVILDNQGSEYLIGSAQESRYSNYLKQSVPANTLFQETYDELQIDDTRTMYYQLPILEGKWAIGYFVPVVWEKQKYTQVLLYICQMILMLLMITWVSYYLSRRMTLPITKAIHFMENYSDDYSMRLKGNDRELEFVIMAQSFNSMLNRLEDLSVAFREKEVENLELDKRVNKLLLRALQSQVNPHFLQNIFTSIMLLLKMNKTQKASNMLVSTAKFLKSGLYGTVELVRLEDEMEHVINYIQIQSIRYENQLQIEFDVDLVFYGIKVPKFILQPLVENAIIHGLKKNQTLEIHISCREIASDYLQIEVKDNGCGMEQSVVENVKTGMINQSETQHYGLSNVHERIQLEFGAPYGLNLKSEWKIGTSILITLPILKKEHNND